VLLFYCRLSLISVSHGVFDYNYEQQSSRFGFLQEGYLSSKAQSQLKCFSIGWLGPKA
jgi:hypothetical protein